ncbi:MAG: response regulator transcription factor [Bacteroidia bacterium]|nr:response regulator transcription factor [Bacteroidia bacterium]
MNFSNFIEPKQLNMLRTLIVDDETHVHVTLKRLLEQVCPQVKVVGEAAGVATGITAIREKSPDLVLLDIQMDDGTGFDLLNHYNTIDFKVIFITAYEKYALQAFGFSAVDYILKPVDPEKLAEAVKRAEQMVQQTFNNQLGVLRDNLNPDNRQKRKLVLKTQENVYLVSVPDIIHCQSDGSYTIFHTVEEDQILVSKGLREYDELLTDHGFFRAHRSHLVNLQHIKRFEKQEGGHVLMTNDLRVPVSSRSRDKLMQLFDEIAGT